MTKLIERIIKAFNSSIEYQKRIDLSKSSNMWQDSLIHEVSRVIQDIADNNIDKVAFHLKNPKTHNLLRGMDYSLALNCYGETEVMTKQVLLNLCYSIGAIKIPAVEFPCYRKRCHEHMSMDIEVILGMLDKYFGFHIDFPNIFNDEVGIPSSRGKICLRAAHALYFLHSIKEATNSRPVTVLEIGAGIGRLAYYAVKMGIVKYTIVDIPTTTIIQGFFLGMTLGEDNVCLFDENFEAKVNIITPEKFQNLKEKYSIIVQFDGLTEMGHINATRYMNKFHELSNIFLSINHETNEYSVRDLYKTRTDMKLIHRHESLYRKGYIEELLSIL